MYVSTTWSGPIAISVDAAPRSVGTMTRSAADPVHPGGRPVRYDPQTQMSAHPAAASFADTPLGPTLARLVVPMFLGMVMIALVGVVDAYFIGMLGTEALAAFGLCYPAAMVMQALMFGLANGITASMSRARGQRNNLPLGAQERLRVKVSVCMALTLATALALLGAALGPVVFHLATSAEIATLALAYYYPYLLSLVLLSIPMSITACMRGFGETRSSATVMVLASLFNAGLDPLFMFGWGPVPAFGMAGASISTVVAYVISASYASWLIHRTLRHVPRGDASGLEPRVVVREVSGIGGPAMLAQALGPVASAMIAALVAGFGTAALAGLGIMQRIDMLVVMMPVATGAGLMPLVGQLAGGGDRRRAAEALRLGRRAMLSWGLVIGLLLNLAATPLAALFTGEADVAGVVRLGLLFAPIGYMGGGLNITTMSCFNAVGHPMLATKLSAIFSLMLLPILAFAGGKLFGLAGLFGGVVAASAVAAWLGTRFMRYADLTL